MTSDHKIVAVQVRGADVAMPTIDGTSSSSPTAADTSSASQRGGYRIHVSRQGTAVHLSLIAGNEYAAVELYEHFVQALERGQLNLELK